MPATDRICLCTQEYPPQVGGVGVAARRLALHLLAAGYEVHVVTPCDSPDGSGEVRRASDEGVIVHRLEMPFGEGAANAPFALRELVRRLDDEVGFTLFHGFFLSAAYPAVAAAMRRVPRRPVVVSIRGNDALTLLDQPFCRATFLPALRQATWVTSVNQMYLDRVAEEVDIKDRCSVIRNGIVPPTQPVSWQLDDASRGVVGTVGQFRQVKDIPLLVRAYAGVSSRLRTRLSLAGYFHDREEEAWSRTLADELGVASEVQLTGQFPHSQVASHLRMMHVYVQSSAFEGLPNALLEAASCGVPLVATAVGGPGEVIRDGQDGLLVPHGEPRAMSAAIERVLDDDGLASRLSAGARKLAALLSPDRERDEWLALYDRLLGRL
jgi:glycosyltransferase involved in cell wall biosynthesis